MMKVTSKSLMKFDKKSCSNCDPSSLTILAIKLESSSKVVLTTNEESKYRYSSSFVPSTSIERESLFKPISRSILYRVCSLNSAW